MKKTVIKSLMVVARQIVHLTNCKPDKVRTCGRKICELSHEAYKVMSIHELNTSKTHVYMLIRDENTKTTRWYVVSKDEFKPKIINHNLLRSIQLAIMLNDEDNVTQSQAIKVNNG